MSDCALPHLELSDHHRSPFDEAVLIIGGREEDTITIECTGALDLAHVLILYVNNYQRVVATLTAAELALRAAEIGKPLPELLGSIDALCRQLKELTGAAA